MKKLILIFLLSLSFSGISQNIYLHCGKLIDTQKAKVLKEMTVVISNNKIISVEKGYLPIQNPEDVVIDLKTKTVMPGLIDMHVHIEHETNPKRYLQKYTLNDADVAFNSLGFAKATLHAGFTTVRDLGGSGVNIALRNAINSGKVDGPRIFTAGKSIATTGGHADPTNGSRKELMGNPGPKEGVVNSVGDAKKR